MGVMRDNMRNMAERDVQLQDLEGKSNTLHVASGTFSAHATRLRKEQEWQRCKTRLAIISVVLFLIWILIFIFIGERMTFLIISIGDSRKIRSLSATSTQSECRKVVGGSEGAAPLSTWGETNKIGDPNLASMVTKDMGMGQRSKPIITYCYIAILGTRVLWRAGDETLDLGSQVGLGQRFAVAPSHQVSSLNWAMRKIIQN